MSWKSIGYSLLCVAGPVVWGLIVYRVSGVIEKRALQARLAKYPDAPDDTEALTVEYYI